jgi:error-prone DNA polymerase
MIHPLELYRESWQALDIVFARDMDGFIGNRVQMIGWWVTNKMVYTKNEEPMAFISFEDHTALYETVFFPDAFQRYCSRFTPVRPYLLTGRIEDDLGAVALHVEKLAFLPRKRFEAVPGPQYKMLIEGDKKV